MIGQVAFTKKHKWMLSDINSVWQSHHGLADNCELLQVRVSLRMQIKLKIYAP